MRVNLLQVSNQLTHTFFGRSMREFPRLTEGEKSFLQGNNLPAGFQILMGVRQKHHHVLACWYFLLMNVFISAAAIRLQILWVPMLTEGQRLTLQESSRSLLSDWIAEASSWMD